LAQDRAAAQPPVCPAPPAGPRARGAMAATATADAPAPAPARPRVEMEDLPARVKRPVAPSSGPAPPLGDDLVLAARDGDVDAMRELLAEAGESPLFHIDARDRLGRSLLWYAVANGQLEATRLLLSRRASPGQRDVVGWTLPQRSDGDSGEDAGAPRDVPWAPEDPSAPTR